MTRTLFKTLPLHTEGRTLIVGDIHGHFTRLQEALDAVGFDPTKDRLVGAGDAIDRGPESIEVMRWLQYPWFSMVAGNHEAFALEYPDISATSWHRWGGAWFMMLEDDEQKAVQAELKKLPVVIEIETTKGMVGVVHAEPVLSDWLALKDILTLPKEKIPRKLRKTLVYALQGSRQRYEDENITKVRNVRAVVVGHQPVECRITLGNVMYIDTRGWVPTNGHFTLINAETLKPEPVIKRKV